MFTSKRYWLGAFGVPFVLLVLALILALTTPLAASIALFLFIIALVLSSRLGGWRPGLLVTLLATVASIYFFLPSTGIFGIGSFALGALCIVVFLARDSTQQKTAATEVVQLQAIINASEDAIITKTLDGIIQTWNASAERLFGYSAAEVIGKSVQFAYPPERLAEFSSIVERLKRGEAVDHFDTVRVAKDGRRIDVAISETLMHDAQGKVIGVSKVVRDITARKHAEATAHFLAQVNEVLASSLDYETTLASITRLAVPHVADWCAVYITLEDGTIQQLALTHVDPAKIELANQVQSRYLNDPTIPYSVPNVIQTGKPKLAPPFVDESHGARAATQPANLPELGLKSLMVVPLIAPGRTFGAITFVSAESGRSYGQTDLALAQDLARRAALAVENARLYQTAQALNKELDQRVAQRTEELRNANRELETEVTEHQHARDQLRLLAAHLQSAREEERIKIASAIHDEVGSLMTALKIDLSFLRREIDEPGNQKSPEVLRADIDAMLNLIDEAIETVHGIARELRPSMLDHLGLRATLEWQLQEFQEHTRIVCHFESDLDETTLEPQRSTAVFRILQESLTNVARHAHATRVEVSLREEDHRLILQVRDNGIGISATPDENRFGILGMRERAHVFGGEVTLHGTPGQGTVVTVQIPL